MQPFLHCLLIDIKGIGSFMMKDVRYYRSNICTSHVRHGKGTSLCGGSRPGPHDVVTDSGTSTRLV